MKYKIIFDSGKPYEVLCDSDEALKFELERFYKENKNNDYQYDVQVLEFQEHIKFIDISETQFIKEMIGEIIQ